LLDELETKLNISLAIDFGPEWRIKYDTSNVDALQENYTGKVDDALKLWSMGLPFNEINAKLKLGFEDMESGEVGYLPSGLLPTDFDPMIAEPKGMTPEELAKLSYGK
jgi:hypothetical protein